MRVPQILEQQVMQQQLPGVRVDALVDPAAGEVGKGLGQLGDAVTGAEQDIKRHVDTLKATDAATQYEHDWTTASLGNMGGTDPHATPAGDGTEPPPAAPSGPSSAAVQASKDDTSGLSPKGLFNEHGQDAVKYSHPTFDWMAQRRSEIAASLGNDAQRNLFLRSSAPRLEEYHAQIERHTSQQVEVATNQTLTARMGAGLDAIDRDISAPGVKDTDIEYSLDTNVDEVARNIKALHPGELGVQQAAEYKAKATEQVLTHYLDGKDARGAQNFFDRRREDLGDKADQYGRAVKVLTGQQDAVQVAGGIVDSARRPDGTYDIAALDKKALALPAEKRTDMVMKELTMRRALASQVNSSVTSDNFNTALSAYQKSFNLNDIPASTSAWIQQNDPKGWKAILDEDHRHQQQLHSGRDVETPDQLGTFYELKDTYREMSPDELAKADPKVIVSDALKMGLSAKRAGQLADTVLGLKGQAPANDGSLSKSQNDIITGALEDAGMTKPNNRGGVRVANEFLDIREKVEQEVLKQQASLRGASSQKHRGYALDGEDLEKFIGPMLTPVVTKKGFLWDDKAPGIRAPGYQSAAVPPHDADQIRSALQSAGQDASPERIQEVYRAHHGAPAPGPQRQDMPAGTTKVEDLAKDPQTLSTMHPASQRAVAQLAADFTPARLPGATLRPPAKPKPVVLPEVKLSGKPSKLEHQDEQALTTMNESIKGM